LGSSEIRGDGDGIVEPIVPRKGESVSRGEKPGGIDVEGSYVPMRKSERQRQKYQERIMK
jgi:hypothetical protein